MHSERVPSRFVSRQPLVLLASFGACGLSAWATVTFFRDTHPPSYAVPMELFGAVLETCKVLFSNESLKNVASGGISRHPGSVALFLFSVFLAAISITCSVGNLQQIDSTAQAAALMENPEYRRAQAVFNDANSTVERLGKLATKMQDRDYISASSKEEKRIGDAEKRRDLASAHLKGLEHSQSPANVDFIGHIANVLSRERPTLADQVRLGWHVLLAITLEALGMLCISKLDSRLLAKRLDGDGDDSDSVNGPGSPLRVVPAKQQRRRTHAGSATARTQTGTASNSTQSSTALVQTRKRKAGSDQGRGDTGVGESQFSNRCNQLKEAVLAGEVDLTIATIKEFVGCGQTVAYRYADHLVDDGWCGRDPKGKLYRLQQAA